MGIIHKIKTYCKNNVISSKMSKLVELSPIDLLEERRKNWSKGKLSHAAIFGHREASFQIIEEDIIAVHAIHDSSHIYVITDFYMPESGGYTKYVSRYRKLRMMDRCEVYNFNILNDADFLKQIYSLRETESIWLYIISSSDEGYSKSIWREINRLADIGRKYNVIVTFVSSGMNLKNDSLRCIISDASYLIFTPSKDIALKDIQCVANIEDASFLKYEEEHDNATSLPVLILTPIDEHLAGYKIFYCFLQLHSRGTKSQNVPICEGVSLKPKKGKPFVLSSFETGDIITFANNKPSSFPDEEFHIKDKQIVSWDDRNMKFEAVSVNPVCNEDGSYDVNYGFEFTIEDVISIERDGVLYNAKDICQ